MTCHICRQLGREILISSTLSSDKITRINITELWCINKECLFVDKLIETQMSITHVSCKGDIYGAK